MQIELGRAVAARQSEVFKVVADIQSWPRVIGSVGGIEMLTHGGIRVGTRVRVSRIIYGHETNEDLEVEIFERPRRLCLIGKSRGMRYERDHVIDALHDGTRLMLIFRTKPETAANKAIQDFISPFMQISLRDEIERDLVDLAAAAAQLEKA